MFSIDPSPTFTASVAIPVPGGPAQALTLVFRHKRKSEIQRFLDGAAGREDADLISEIVAGWKDVDAEFCADNLARLLDAYPAAAWAILEAWVDALGRAREKN